MAQRPGLIIRVNCHVPEPEPRGAPLLAARHGAPGGLEQQRVLTRRPAAHDPPRRQRGRQPQRDGRIVHQSPGQHLPYRGVLGIEPPASSHLRGSGFQSRSGLLRHPQRVPGQRGGRLVLLPGAGQQPGPEDPQRLQHHVPGPAIRIGPRRAQQRAVHQVQHRRPGAGPGDRLGGLQRERPGEHRHGAEHPLLRLIQQLVTPLHGGLQRPLPGRRQPVPGRQQREPVTRSGPAAAPPRASRPAPPPARSPAASRPAAPPAVPPGARSGRPA